MAFRCVNIKSFTHLFCWFNWAHWALYTKWMHRTENITRIFGHFSHNIPVQFFIMKGYIDLLLEEEWRKRYDFSTFISAIENITSPTDIKLALNQGNNFINLYNSFFNNHYVCWLKEILPISISSTPETFSIFVWWYPVVTEPDKAEVNIVYFEVHDWNLGTMRLSNCSDFFTINPKFLYRYPIVSHKSAIENL